MPAPAFVGASSYRSNSATSLSRTSASIGASEGDVLIAVVRTVGNKTLTLDSGWTEVSGSSQYYSGQRTSAYVRVATASEPANYTFSWTGSANAALGIVAYSGADGTPDVAAIASGSDSPSVTTTADDARVIVAATANYDDTAFGFTHPSGTTERTETSDAWQGLAIADFEHATAGATGAKAWTIWDAGDWQALTIALLSPPPVVFAGASYESHTIASLSSAAGTETLTPGLPTGTQPGDLLLALGVTDQDGAYPISWIDPSGWTVLENDGSGDGTYRLWGRIATGNEPTHDFTLDPFNTPTLGDASVAIYRISGAFQDNTLSDMTVVATRDTEAGTPGTSIPCPSVTPPADNYLILHLAFHDVYDAGNPLTVPAGETEIHSTMNVFGVAASYIEQSTAAATGVVNFTANSSGSVFGYTVAIRPQHTPSAPVSAATLQTDIAHRWGDSQTDSVGSNSLSVQSNAANGSVMLSTPAKVGSFAINSFQSGGETGLYHVATSPTLNLTPPFTFAGWAKQSSGATDAKTWLTLSGTDGDLTVEQAAGTSSNVPLKLYSSGIEQATDQRSAGTYGASTYTFVVIRANRFGQVELRLNDAAFDAGQLNAYSTIDELQIGHITTDGQAWLHDELVLWTRELSDDEVDELYNSGSGNSWPYRVLPSAGITFGASPLDPGPITTVLPSAGITFGASAPIAIVNTALPSAGITFGASSPDPGPITTSLAAAGITFEAVAPVEPTVHTTLPSAGITFGAHASIPPVNTAVPSAGITFGAASPAEPVYTSVPMAGITFGAASPQPSPVVTTVASAGITFGANAPQPGPVVTTVAAAGITFGAASPNLVPVATGITRLRMIQPNGSAPVAAQRFVVQTTEQIAARLVKDDGTEQFPLTGLNMALLTVWDRDSKTLIRPSHDVLNAGTVAIVATTNDSGDAITQLTWSVEPLDTELVNVARGSETHLAAFEFAWDATLIRSLSNPISTTAGSASVTVTASSHGLVVNDWIAIVGSSTVGGLQLDGLHLVRSVIDANRFTIEHRPRLTTIDTNAAATAVGGGAVQLLINPRTQKSELTLRLNPIDVT